MLASGRLLLAALFLAFCIVADAAKAGDLTPRCPVPTSTALANLMLSAPDAVVFEFRGERARAAIRVFDSLPPRGTDVGDRFYIAMRPGFPWSQLMIAEGGCIENAVVVDVRIAVAIKRAIKRVDASVSI